MNKKNFTQGLEHAEAEKKNLSFADFEDYDNSIVKLWNNFNSLKHRPDYGGFVTISEGIAWAKSHPGALKHPTPENALYIDASMLDFGNLTASHFQFENVRTPQNLFNAGNLVASSMNAKLRATIYALGRVNMQLIDRSSGTVRIVNGKATDYDWNKGGGFWRNTFISMERVREGLNDSYAEFNSVIQSRITEPLDSTEFESKWKTLNISLDFK